MTWQTKELSHFLASHLLCRREKLQMQCQLHHPFLIPSIASFTLPLRTMLNHQIIVAKHLQTALWLEEQFPMFSSSKVNCNNRKIVNQWCGWRRQLSAQNASLAYRKLWVQSLAPNKMDCLSYTWNHSAWESLAGTSGPGGYPQLHSKFRGNLGYRRPCIKNKQTSKIQYLKPEKKIKGKMYVQCVA